MIWRAKVVSDSPEDAAVDAAAPGTLVRVNPTPVVKCGDGFIALVELQAPGRRRMAAADFIRGRRLVAGAHFGE
jgi:methionyl-tRNA formyltransferase